MTGVWVWGVEHDAMIEVTRAEAAAGVQRYARSLGAGTAACGVWEQRAVELVTECACGQPEAEPGSGYCAEFPSRPASPEADAAAAASFAAIEQARREGRWPPPCGICGEQDWSPEKHDGHRYIDWKLCGAS